MSGTMLNSFDVTLCAYALTNIRLRMCKPAFYEYAKHILEPQTLAYLTALGNEDGCEPLLLTEAELYDIADDFAGGPVEHDLAWESDERVHRQAIFCTSEIREVLALAHADAWARASADFAAELEGGKARLSTGIHVISSWVCELRRFLRAMGATAFLPHPEGSFPTPRCPELPAKRKNLTLNGSPQTGDAMLTAISEIRELLVSQRTVKDWYSTEEAAKILGKAEFTIRNNCRLGRIKAEKKTSGRGKFLAWVISHAEILRIQKEGLLPLGAPD